MKKILVTGANGYIGKAVLKELSNNNIEICAVIRNKDTDTSQIESIPGVTIVYCDMASIHNLPDIVGNQKFDTCIHLAWAGSFGDERADYDLQLANVKYSLNLVDTLSKMGVRRFVGAGTLAEKDVLNYHVVDGAVPNAVSMYGIAKISAHFMTKAECTKHGIEHIWCFLSNTYSDGSTINNFVMMASKLLLNGKRAAFTAGEQIYDFMYLTDTARAICCAADKGHVNTAYYLGSNHQRKLKEYITIIRDTINPSVELHLGEIPFKGIPLPPEAYDSEKLRNDTGFEPEVSFEEGIKRTINWLKSQNDR